MNVGCMDVRQNYSSYTICQHEIPDFSYATFNYFQHFLIIHITMSIDIFETSFNIGNFV